MKMNKLIMSGMVAAFFVGVSMFVFRRRWQPAMTWRRFQNEASLISTDNLPTLLTILGISSDPKKAQDNLVTYKMIYAVDTNMNSAVKGTINDFITYGTPSTLALGAEKGRASSILIMKLSRGCRLRRRTGLSILEDIQRPLAERYQPGCGKRGQGPIQESLWPQSGDVQYP